MNLLECEAIIAEKFPMPATFSVRMLMKHTQDSNQQCRANISYLMTRKRLRVSHKEKLRNQQPINHYIATTKLGTPHDHGELNPWFGNEVGVRVQDVVLNLGCGG